MDIQELLRASWLIILLLDQSDCDWLNCAHIVKCNCKWSSGKKTALCVSAGLTNLPRLSPDIQVLDLHGNPLRELNRDAFANIDLLNLQRLNLSNTKLRRIHKNAFRGLRILIELDISQNELYQLSSEIFKGIERLRLLILSDNPINELYTEQFPPLQHLKKLEIARCQLQNIHPLAFTNLRALETIYAHQNLLSYVHPNTFNLPFLKTLTLSDNPWYCDCKLRDFHEWFLSANLGNEDILCTGPSINAQVLWRDIKEPEMVCPPSAISSPSVLRAEVGAEITFGCFVTGDPKPSVHWYFHNNEIHNITNGNNVIQIFTHNVIQFDEYNNDIISKSSQWVNISINNITKEVSGEWKCHANSSVGEASATMTLFLLTARTATARSAPEFSIILVVVSMLGMTGIGFVAACVCWKTRRRPLPPSRSFTDQEKKLLDSSLAASCDRQSVDLESSYGLELLDRSISMDSEDTQRCLENVHITLETSSIFPPSQIGFTLPAPYSNIFISVKLSDPSDECPDLLENGRSMSRRSRTCVFESSNDNMGPRVTAAGSSTWSLPEDAETSNITEGNITTPFPTISTEYTAL